MILDKHGNPMKSSLTEAEVQQAKAEGAKEWDEFREWNFDDLHGDSDQVLVDSFAMNTGSAITEADLFTDGDYPLFEIPNAVKVWAHKSPAGICVRMWTADWLDEDYARRLQQHKDRFEEISRKPNFRETEAVWPIYVLDKYHYVYLMFAHNVDPDMDEKEFEKVLWREMPFAWVDVEMAPKH